MTLLSVLALLGILALLGVLTVSIGIASVGIRVAPVSTATVSVKGCVNIDASGLQSVKVVLVARVRDGLDCLLEVGTRVSGAGWKEQTSQL